MKGLLRRVRFHHLFRLIALSILLCPFFVDLERAPFIPPEYVLVLDGSSSMEERFPGFGGEVLSAWGSFRGEKRGIVTSGDGKNADLGSALSAAVSLFSPLADKRLILSTDGLSTRGTMAEALHRLRDAEIKVFALTPPRPVRQASVLDIALPARVYLWEPFAVKGRLLASSGGPVTAVLRRNGVEIGRQEAILDGTGVGEVFFTQEADRVGAAMYSLGLDGHAAIPVAGEVQVGAAPRLRFVGDDLEAAGKLIGLFRETGVEVTASRPDDLLYETEPFKDVDVILLDDLPAPALSESLMEKVRKAVGVEGKGLLVIGGRKGLGSDEFRDSPLEAVLPVTAGYSDPPEPLPVSLVIAMDTSFSMFFRGRGQPSFAGDNPRKIDVAKESAREVVRIIRPEDRFGILGNSTDLFWIQKLGSVEDQAAVMANIDPVKPEGGGLNFYSIVRESYLALRESPTAIRHLLVLGDAEDIDQYEVAGEGHSFDLIRRMVREGITLSILAFGQPTDKDIPFLRTASFIGKGDFYIISNLRALPRYFISEYRKLSVRNFVEEKITPLAGDYSPVLFRIDGSLPSLAGIVTVTPRQGSETPVRTDLGTPLFTTGTYGKGKTAVFASDNGYRWAARWLEWSGSRRFWTQALFAVTPDEQRDQVVFPSLRADNTQDRFTLSVGTGKGDFPPWEELWLQGSGPAGDPGPIRLARTGLSAYRSSRALPPAGFYRFRLHSEPERTGELSRLSINVPPPAEHLPLPENWSLVERILTETGGTWVAAPGEAADNTFFLDLRKDILFVLIVAAGMIVLLAETIVKHISWR
jgi:hypothetical protein